MTVALITLKKLIKLFYILFALTGVAIASDKVPKILRVGVIPVQLEGLSDDISSSKEFSSKHQIDFLSAVEQTKRFRLLNADLVEKLWSNSSGRRQLVAQYEMDALVRLKISGGGETINFVSELLSPQLTSYLYESDAMNLEDLKDSKKIQAMIRKLVYRLVNRLPVDGFIITTQGPYATIGAGAEQGVVEGAEFDVFRSSVETLHPATGAWLTFNVNRVGRVKAVDVKKSTTIAKIEDQVYENSILPGDGIKIPEIASRKMFNTPDIEIIPEDEEESTMATPVYVDPKKKLQKTAEKSPNDVEEPGQANAPSNGKPSFANKATPAENSESTSDEVLSWENIRKNHKDIADTYRLFGGTYDWSVEGPNFTGSSNWPVWLISDFGILLTKKQSEGMLIDYGAEFFIGGNFYGFKVFAQPTWTLKPSVMPEELSTFRVGGIADFSTRNVNGSDFGGADILKSGPFAGVSGLLKQVPFGLIWTLDTSLPIFGFGRVGYSGSKKSANSVTGLDWKLQGLLAEPIDNIQYGFIIDYGNDFYKTDDGSIRERYMKLHFQAQMKW